MKKGQKTTEEIREKMRHSALRRIQEKPWTNVSGWNKGDRTGIIPGNYKGETASYAAHHHWIKHHLAKEGRCENCGIADKTEYSNISGDYLRDTSDWCELCVNCHRLIDDNVNKSWLTRKANV